jgi:hypothetical protein
MGKFYDGKMEKFLYEGCLILKVSCVQLLIWFEVFNINLQSVLNSRCSLVKRSENSFNHLFQNHEQRSTRTLQSTLQCWRAHIQQYFKSPKVPIYIIIQSIPLIHVMTVNEKKNFSKKVKKQKKNQEKFFIIGELIFPQVSNFHELFLTKSWYIFILLKIH